MSSDNDADAPVQEPLCAGPGPSPAVALRTRRLQISAADPSDIDALVAYRRDPAVARYQSWRSGYDTAQALRLVADQPSSGLPAPGRWLQLALRDRVSDRPLGDLGVHALADQPDTYELGATLVPNQQGRGLAREALGRVLALFFDDGRAHRVTASCDLRNTRAARLRVGLGLRHEARLVEADRFEGGWTTLDTCSVVAREWRRPRDEHGGVLTAADRRKRASVSHPAGPGRG